MAKPVTYPHRRLIQLDDKLKEKLDNFRFAHRFRTEADAMRVAMDRGIDVLNAEAQTEADPKRKR